MKNKKSSNCIIKYFARVLNTSIMVCAGLLSSAQPRMGSYSARPGTGLLTRPGPVQFCMSARERANVSPSSQLCIKTYAVLSTALRKSSKKSTLFDFDLLYSRKIFEMFAENPLWHELWLYRMQICSSYHEQNDSTLLLLLSLCSVQFVNFRSHRKQKSIKFLI